MGVEVFFYGYIGWRLADAAENHRIIEHNGKVLSKLPSPSECEYFHRSMFQMPSVYDASGSFIPWYKEAAILFGFSYKNAYTIDAPWVEKFEELLGQLYWNAAAVHNSFSSVSIHWRNEKSETIGMENAKNWKVYGMRADSEPSLYQCMGEEYDFKAQLDSDDGS